MKTMRLSCALTILLTQTCFASPLQKPAKQLAEAKLSLGTPIQVGSLAIVPIRSTRPLGLDKYMTLAEAVKKQLVEIVEQPGREEVNALEVRNKGSVPLILFAGELLLGGKQDRIVGKDTIVPPKESRKVPVFCVEHGRWQGSKMEFQPAETLVSEPVRKAATEEKSQERVWSRVAEAADGAKATSATGTFAAILKDPKVAADVRKTTDRLERHVGAFPDAVGVIYWLDGKIRSADLYADTQLFSASRRKLLNSHSVDARIASKAKPLPVDVKACEEFLGSIVKARRTLDESGRHDSLYRIKNGKVVGYESGGGKFMGQFGGGGMGGMGGAAGSGFGHGTYRPGGSPK